MDEDLLRCSESFESYRFGGLPGGRSGRPGALGRVGTAFCERRRNQYNRASFAVGSSSHNTPRSGLLRRRLM